MRRNRKTAVLALTAMFLVATSLLAQGKPKAVAVEAIKDAGTTPKGEKISVDFLIRNEGDAPLEITNVQPACGCTVADFDKTIPPGGTGKVHASVDTTNFNGPISKGVTVYTNAPDTPQLELTIRAKVEPYISVKPGYARYITVQGEPLEGNIAQTLWATDDQPLEIVSVDSPWPYLKVSFREAKTEERVPEGKGREWRVEMTLSNDAQVGALSDFVTIHTSHPKQKMVKIPISGFVRPVIAVTPPIADFGQIELKEPLRKVFNVRNFATEPIKITAIEGGVQGVDLKLEPLEEGREYQVRVTLNTTLPKGAFSGTVVLKTDSPKMPTLNVELKGIVL